MLSPEQIKIPERLTRFANTPKRFKIMIGGRGSGKSETIAALFAAMVHQSGCRAVCCREFQASIKQSVHNLVSRKVRDFGLEDPSAFSILDKEIRHANGGEIIYQGLARDPQAIKSVDDAEICWAEEAQSLSERSIEELTPSIRGKDSEIWFSANLGNSKDPFSQKFIKPFEKELRKHKWYEDELHLICWINYDENPWFPIELQRERLRDKEVMSDAAYAHKWLGEYNDTVENALIQPSWFDACIDAHKILRFKPQGIEVVSHDPSDTGADAKGLAYRHGNVFLDVQERDFGDIHDGGDWAVDYAISRKPDAFIWDCDGMGVGLKRQFNKAFEGKRIRLEPFHGGAGVEDPDAYYNRGEEQHPRTNKDTFRNRRAQRYWELRDRCQRTWRAVVNGEYTDPDELISFSSDIEAIDLLRSEICSVPLKNNGRGLIQILSKAEMAQAQIASPNMADSVMMSLDVKAISRRKKKRPEWPRRKII